MAAAQGGKGYWRATVVIMSVWALALIAALAVNATGVHVSLIRDAQWERDVRLLVGNGSGHTNSSQ